MGINNAFLLGLFLSDTDLFFLYFIEKLQYLDDQ